MGKIYISVDVEASGPSPGKYSMLSLGACVVGNTEKTFYAELKPISFKFVEDNMQIGASKLEALNSPEIREIMNRSGERFLDTNWNSFSPILALARLDVVGKEPEKVMSEFNEWILECASKRRPVMAAAPIVWDGMFINWYFDNFFDGENPFGFNGEDMNSFARGKDADLWGGTKRFAGIYKKENLHHAMHDAIDQAKRFEKVLEGIKGWKDE